MKLKTRGGTIELLPLAGASCSACGAPTMLEADAVRLVVETVGPTLDVPSLCGDCLSEALALLFGRRHVQRGGNVADFVFGADPPAA